jgi:hypothetical protein
MLIQKHYVASAVAIDLDRGSPLLLSFMPIFDSWILQVFSTSWFAARAWRFGTTQRSWAEEQVMARGSLSPGRRQQLGSLCPHRRWSAYGQRIFCQRR